MWEICCQSNSLCFMDAKMSCVISFIIFVGFMVLWEARGWFPLGDYQYSSKVKVLMNHFKRFSPCLHFTACVERLIKHVRILYLLCDNYLILQCNFKYMVMQTWNSPFFSLYHDSFISQIFLEHSYCGGFWSMVLTWALSLKSWNSSLLFNYFLHFMCLNFLLAYIYICMYVHHMACLFTHRGQKRTLTLDSPELEFTDGCKPLCGCWEPNSGLCKSCKCF